MRDFDSYFRGEIMAAIVVGTPPRASAVIKPNLFPDEQYLRASMTRRCAPSSATDPGRPLPVPPLRVY